MFSSEVECKMVKLTDMIKEDISEFFESGKHKNKKLYVGQCN